MGGSCCRLARVSDVTDSFIAEYTIKPPDAIESVCGVTVKRDSGLYQYALFCVTRLADDYKQYLFPDIPMSFGSFREDIKDYLALCHELFSDLNLDERLVPNQRVSEQHDICAKSALSELAFDLMDKSDVDKAHIQGVKENLVVRPSFNLTENDLVTDEIYAVFFEDTVKVIITDFERKDIWQMSTLFSNKEFCERLQEKEPATCEALCRESIYFRVPIFRQEKRSSNGSLTSQESVEYEIPIDKYS